MFMKKLLEIVKKLTTKKFNKWVRMAFIGSIFLIENKWFGQEYFRQLTGGYSMVDMNMFNTTESITNYLHVIGETGRSAYLILLGMDFILVITFFLLQTTLIEKLLKGLKASHFLRLLILFPLGRGIMDIIENITMVINTTIYPEAIPSILLLSAISTFIKWVCLWGTVVILVILIVLNVRNIILKKMNKAVLN